MDPSSPQAGPSSGPQQSFLSNAEYEGLFSDYDYSNSATLAMPGAFRTVDSMDLDELPPFTIELELLYDHLNDRDSHRPETDLFHDTSLFQTPTQAPVPHTGLFVSMQNAILVAPGVLANEHLRNPSVDSYYNQFLNASVHNGFAAVGFNPANELSPLTTTTSLTPSVSSVHSTQPLFFLANQYLHRNSLDQPPLGQHRPLLDMYPKGRPSVDSQASNGHRNQRYISFTNSISNYIPFMGDKNAPRLGPPSPLAQAPFMPTPVHLRHLIRSIFKSNSTYNNDENDVTYENEDGPPQDNFMEGIINENEFFVTSPRDEMDLENSDPAVAKKARRTKRSLFTRFKTPVKTEPDDVPLTKVEDLTGSANTINENRVFSNESYGLENMPGITLRHSSSSFSGTSASTSNILTNGNTSHNQLEAAGLADSVNGLHHHPEPDYAALFQNVGKRKNIVNPSAYIKSKPKVKTEGFDEKSQTIIPSNASNGDDHYLNFSVSSSNGSSSFRYNVSHVDEQPSSATSAQTGPTKENGVSTTSSLANASKRILGSKLMLMKKSLHPQTQQHDLEQTPTHSRNSSSNSLSTGQSNERLTTVSSTGMEVAVDLASLDLPVDTQIFPTSIINSKNRTRGRKENKQADLVDLSKIYLCNYCSRRFKRQEHLKRHFRSLHTFEKPYDCPICNKKFSRSDNLNQHLKIHKHEEEEAAAAVIL